MKTKHKIILGVTGLMALFWGVLGLTVDSKPTVSPVGATILFPHQGGTGIGSATAGDVGKFLKLSDDSPMTYILDSASGGSQTPWGSNIEGANYSLSHVGSLDATSSSFTDATTTHLAVIGTATTTFAGGINMGANHLVVHGVQSDASDGLHIHAGNGTNVGLFGAGNTANSLFYGGVNIDGATRLATSLTGLLQAYSGTVSAVATSSLNLLVGSFLSPNISQWTNDSAYITSASLPVGGNPTASVGVTAVNGVATTFMRSDASPALDSGLYSTFNGKVSSSSLSATYPLAYNSSTGAFTFNGLSTSTTWTAGQVAYVTNNNTVSSVATGTISGTSPLSVTASRYVLGGSATVAWDFSVANTWTGLQTFNTGGILSTASSTIFSLTSDKATTTSASSTDLYSLRALFGTFSFTSATGTNIFATNASTTRLHGANLTTCTGSNFLQWSAGLFGCAAGGSSGGGDSKFSTSTINPLAIFMNAGDSLGLGTSTNRSALSMLALATTTGNHLTMRNGNTTWFQKVNDTGSWFMGTTSGAYATATHSALIVPTTGGLIVQGSGSSTLRNGITIEAGCFSVNGTCIGSGGTLTGSNASAGRVGFWSSANNIDGDGDFTWDGALNKLFALKGAFSTSLEIATGTAPTVDRVGGIAFDTTDNQFLIGTTTDVSVAVLPTRQKLWGATIASTSLEMVSGGRLWLPPQRDGFDIMEIHCAVDAGTSVVINISNSGGTTDTETVTCDADGAVDTSIGTNPSYAAGSLNSLEIGTITGAVDYLTFSVWGNIKRE